MADEYIFIEIFATNKIVTTNTASEIASSILVASPIITLNGMQNGEDIGTIAAILFKLLAGFIIVKYDR